MEETTASPGLRLFVGVVAGAVVGILLLMAFDRREPPVPISRIAVPALAGAIGALAALLAGGRRVSVFWPYVVVVFGLITVMPWWHDEKTHSYLPLGTIYVHRARTDVILQVFVPHLLVSLALAVGLSMLHRRLFARPAG